MKVLLVYPVPPRTHWPRGNFRAHWIPTGLAYISSALRQAGHEVRVLHREEQLAANGFDWQFCDTQLRSLLKHFSPDMVGISVVTPMMIEAEVISRWAKEICGQRVIVVVGGPHPTALPEKTLLECPYIDVVVIGEGERTMVELADTGPDKQVAGLVFRQNGQLVHTSARPLEKDLDSLAVPDYSQFNMDFHLQVNPWLVRWIPRAGMNIHTSRGCTNCCGFCAAHVISGMGVRFHSIGYVLERLLEAVRFGAKLILFGDDSLAANGERLLELCEAMCSHGLHRHIKWQCCMRVDQVSPEVLTAVKSAGCIQIEFGFESGSDTVLQRIDKNTSVHLNRRAVRLTRQAGIRIYANIMIGLPGETEEDLRKSLDFIRWAKPDVLSAACPLPLPGTALYNNLPEQVRNSLKWSDYTYADTSPGGINLTAMSEEAFEDYRLKFFKYFVRPTMNLQMLRDMSKDPTSERRMLRRKIIRFALQHPLRTVRLPC